MNKTWIFSGILLLAALLFSGCAGPASAGPASAGATSVETASDPALVSSSEQPGLKAADVSYTLQTSSQRGLAYVGVGGEINGEINPTLHARPGDVVELTLVNGDGMLHDLKIDELGASTGELSGVARRLTIRFSVTEAGTYTYYCSIPGHRQGGMSGELVVAGAGTAPAESGGPSAAEGGSETGAQPASAVQSEAPQAGAASEGANIVHHPADLPAPLGERLPQTVRLDLTAEEVLGQLADGTTYSYFTFNGAVPGPFLRVLAGDTVELHLANAADSMFSHSIDLHAVTGPGGGHIYTETSPGQSTSFTFKALKPGLYVYHCATPSVPHHITNGMYGLILVEPPGGLPPVDREYYVMQGELYTAQPYGAKGQLDFSHEKMSNEAPEYYVFNGAAGALTQANNQLTAEVGDTVRIFFGVGGPNKTSSFHVIGEIFDRAYEFGSLSSPPLLDVQTISVPPGGAWVVDFQVDVPGTYILVDHALSRAERGLAGYLTVTGPEQPEIFHGEQAGH